MIYPFQCPACGTYLEVIRHHSESHLGHVCQCGQPMTRVYSVPQVSIPATGYYDLGLGAQINSKRDKADAVKRINDKTGMSLVEVGNENVKAKPKVSNYDVPRGIFDHCVTD